MRISRRSLKRYIDACVRDSLRRYSDAPSYGEDYIADYSLRNLRMLQKQAEMNGDSYSADRIGTAIRSAINGSPLLYKKTVSGVFNELLKDKTVREKSSNILRGLLDEIRNLHRMI